MVLGGCARDSARLCSYVLSGYRLVLARNYQPSDLPCPYMVSREGRVYMADMGYGQNVVFEPYIQGFIAPEVST